MGSVPRIQKNMRDRIKKRTRKEKEKMSDMNAKNLTCRGKAAHGWVEGYYLPANLFSKELGPAIYAFEGEEMLCFPVDPNTVTACSGMLDMSGKLIYDQDIVLSPDMEIGGVVEYGCEDGMFSLLTKDGRQVNFSDALSENFKIVGNTFDNSKFTEII